MAQTNGPTPNDGMINLTADDLNPGGVNPPAAAPAAPATPAGTIDISQDVEQGPTAPQPGPKDIQAVNNPKKINLPPPIKYPTPTVPMFAPDGTQGDIPAERVHEALAAGGAIGVPVLAPDGTHGFVPANRLHEALKAGGKIDSSGWTPDQLNANATVGERLEKAVTGPGMINDPDALKNARNIELAKMSPLAATQEIHQAGSIPLVRPDQAMTPEEQAAHPTLQAGLEFAGSMTSPENLAIMVGSGGLGAMPGPAGPLISKALSAGFSLQVIAQTAQESPKFLEALARGDEHEAKYELTKMVLGLAMAEQGAEHVGTNEATGEKAFNPNLGTAVGTSADALVHAAGEYSGKALGVVKQIPGAVGNVPGAGLVKGVAKTAAGAIAQPVSAMLEGPEAKITRAAGGSAGVQERDFQENIPRALKYIVEENKTNKISTPEDMADAASSQKTKLWQETLGKPHPGETIEGDKIADQIVSGINKSTAQHFPEVADAITKWADTFRGPYNLDDAMSAITDFNAKLRQFYKQSPSDQFRMAQADPKLGMLQDAADALRDVAFDKLEKIGEKNVPELRKDYGALNQMQRIFEKRAVVYGRQAPIDLKQSLGAIAAAASGHLGAAAVPFITKYLNSPEHLIESAISKADKAGPSGAAPKPSPLVERPNRPVNEIRPPGVEPKTPAGKPVAETSLADTAANPSGQQKASGGAAVNPTEATAEPGPDGKLSLEAHKDWQPPAGIEKGISRDEAVDTEIPLSKISLDEKAYNSAASDISRKRGSETDGPVSIVYNPNNGQYLVEDGVHRVVQAHQEGKTSIPAKIWSGYSDVANVEPENKTDLSTNDDKLQLEARRPEEKELYHYTTSPFEEFDPMIGGAGGDFGTHLGTIEQAHGRIQGAGDSLKGTKNMVSEDVHGHVRPVYATIKNPIRLEDHGVFQPRFVAQQLWEKGVLSDKEFESIRGDFGVVKPEDLRDILEKKGYDGAVYMNRTEGASDAAAATAQDTDVGDDEFLKLHPEVKGNDSYIAFRPEQIRSKYVADIEDDNKLKLESRATKTAEPAAEPVRSDFKPYDPQNSEGYEPRIDAPANRRPSGFLPGDEHIHEWGHVTNAALEGWGTEGIQSHLNPDLPSKRTTAAATVIPRGIDWKDADSIARNSGKILSVVLGGAVANELHSGIPFEINRGIDPDVNLLKNTLRKGLDFTDDEIDAAIRYGRDRANRNLTQPGISDMMLENSKVRESGLSPTLHASPERTEAYAEEVRRIQDANRKPAGEGQRIDENRTTPEASGINRPDDAGAKGPTEAATANAIIESNRGLKETSTGDEQADRDIRTAGAIPAGSMMNLALFHDPETGSTLALDKREVTPELIQRHLDESREKFGVKKSSPEKQPFMGSHYSSVPVENDTLRGGDRGKSAAGSEKKRLQHDNKVPGVYAYRNGATPEPQIATRANRYDVGGDKAIADISGREKKLFEGAHEKAFNEYKAAGDYDTVANQKALNDAEAALKEAGFDGYEDKNSKTGSVFLFGDQPVKTESSETPNLDAYHAEKGVAPAQPVEVPVNKAEGARIADAYDEMKHDPTDPAVKASYDALKRDTVEQWKALEKQGVKMTVTDDPDYYNNAQEMLKDIKDNKHIAVWSGEGDMPSDHPLREIEPTTGLPYNTLFRGVHDVLGHGVGGNDFSEQGEENAYNLHRQSYSPEAIPALATDTKGQANWVFNNKALRESGGEPTEFPTQKAALLPEEFHGADPWAYRAAEQAKDGGFTVDPRNGEVLTKGYQVEAIPDVRTDLDHPATPADIQKFYNDNLELFREHPELKVGGYGVELNASASTDSRAAAEKLAKKLDQISIWDVKNAKEIPTGGEGKQTSFPDYPIEQRMADLRGKKLQLESSREDEHTFTHKNFGVDDSIGRVDAVNQDGDSVGHVTYELPKPERRKGDFKATISMASVDEPGKGLGQKLYLQTAEQARAKGARYMVSDTGHGVDPSAVRVWDKLMEKGYPVEKLGDKKYQMDLSKLPIKLQLESSVAEAEPETEPETETGDATFNFGANEPGEQNLSAPYDAENSRRVSTRFPTAVSRTADPMSHELTLEHDMIHENPAIAQRLADKIVRQNKSMVFTPEEVQQGAKGIFNSFIRQAKDNIKSVYERARNAGTHVSDRVWYDGAHAFTKTDAEANDMSHEQAAAVLASLSPQKDWDANVSLYKRIVDVVKNKGDIKMTPEMEKKGAEFVREINAANRKNVAAGKEPTEPWVEKKLINKLKGKSFNQVEKPLEKAAWLRLYDEAHNSRGFDELHADGSVVGPRKTLGGVTEKVAWGDLLPIAKSIRILQDGSRENISQNLGENHKVRSFYNNIIDPNSPHGDVTADTHHVGLSLMRPVAGMDPEPKLNFDGNGSSINGVHGTYPLYVEAARQAMQELNAEHPDEPPLEYPRQLQSVTWVEWRKMFPPESRTLTTKAKVDSIWKEHLDGQITADEARTKISDYAQRLRSGVDEGESGPADEGKLPAHQLHGSGDSRGSGAGPTGGVETQAGQPQPGRSRSLKPMTNKPVSAKALKQVEGFREMMRYNVGRSAGQKALGEK